MHRILIIEDQKRLLSSIQRGLKQRGYETAIAANGEEGYRLAIAESFDAVILDLMLPKRDGMQILRDLRVRGKLLPILILTAKDAVEDKVEGLEAGADDYLVKPFAFAELVARLRALLRRNMATRETVLKADDLEMDLVAGRVARGGIPIELTPREFDLLKCLLRNANSAVTRNMLARDVWKEPQAVLTNVIDVFVKDLRKKIERPNRPQLLHTVRGVGYMLRED